MIHGCEKGNAQRIKINMSQSVLVFLITKGIMKPHFTSVYQQGNSERVILSANGNNAC
jgi:hypothetical protein